MPPPHKNHSGLFKGGGLTCKNDFLGGGLTQVGAYFKAVPYSMIYGTSNRYWSNSKQ